MSGWWDANSLPVTFLWSPVWPLTPEINKAAGIHSIIFSFFEESSVKARGGYVVDQQQFGKQQQSQPTTTTTTLSITSDAQFELHQVVCEGSQSSRQAMATGLSSRSLKTFCPRPFQFWDCLESHATTGGGGSPRVGPEDPTPSIKVFCYIDRMEANSIHWALPCSPTLLHVSGWAHLGWGVKVG